MTYVTYRRKFYPRKERRRFSHSEKYFPAKQKKCLLVSTDTFWLEPNDQMA